MHASSLPNFGYVFRLTIFLQNTVAFCYFLEVSFFHINVHVGHYYLYLSETFKIFLGSVWFLCRMRMLKVPISAMQFCVSKALQSYLIHLSKLTIPIFLWGTCPF